MRRNVLWIALGCVLAAPPAAATTGHERLGLRIVAASGRPVAGRPLRLVLEGGARTPVEVGAFEVAGEGWTGRVLDPPGRVTLAGGVALRVTIEATPADVLAPLELRYEEGGRPAVRRFQLATESSE
ncbi:MAG: hypothetical protein ACRENJ_12385, partial [Candidatus Eiseniibacteriota bacterium]